MLVFCISLVGVGGRSSSKFVPSAVNYYVSYVLVISGCIPNMRCGHVVSRGFQTSSKIRERLKQGIWLPFGGSWWQTLKSFLEGPS